METSKLGFCVVIRRFDNGSDRICAFVTMTCEKRGKYRTPLRNLKRDDTSSRICECPFKMCGYMLVNNNLRFNVICDLMSCVKSLSVVQLCIDSYRKRRNVLLT